MKNEIAKMVLGEDNYTELYAITTSEVDEESAVYVINNLSALVGGEELDKTDILVNLAQQIKSISVLRILVELKNEQVDAAIDYRYNSGKPAFTNGEIQFLQSVDGLLNQNPCRKKR